MTPGPWEILIIVLLVVVLFGAKKLPDAARSIGRSMRIFKSEVKEMSNDDQSQQQAAPQGEITAAQSQPDFWDQPQNQPGTQPQNQPNPNQQNQ